MTEPGSVVRACYTAAVKVFHIQPSEFWRMSIREFFWLVSDHGKHHPRRTKEWAGKMTDADVKRATDFLREHRLAHGK